MSYVERYKQEEQSFKELLKKTDKMREDGFNNLTQHVESMSKDLTRAQMLEIYTGNELDGMGKKLLVASWIKTHEDEATNEDKVLMILAGAEVVSFESDVEHEDNDDCNDSKEDE